MVVISMQPNSKIGRNDYRESAPHFSSQMNVDIFGALFLSSTLLYRAKYVNFNLRAAITLHICVIKDT